jgi:hypothetical protein
MGVPTIVGQYRRENEGIPYSHSFMEWTTSIFILFGTPLEQDDRLYTVMVLHTHRRVKIGSSHAGCHRISLEEIQLHALHTPNILSSKIQNGQLPSQLQ